MYKILTYIESLLKNNNNHKNKSSDEKVEKLLKWGNYSEINFISSKYHKNWNNKKHKN